MQSNKKIVSDAYIDDILEAEWDREHFWPDALVVDGHDIGAERRALIRAMNTARQNNEMATEELAAPSDDDLEEIEKEMADIV